MTIAGLPFPTAKRRQRPFYVASIDRVGLAIGAGALLGGTMIALLAAMSGIRVAWMMLSAGLAGSLLSAIAIVVIGGPAWLALHAVGWRAPWVAAITGAVLGLLVIGIAQRSAIWIASVTGNVQMLTSVPLMMMSASAIGWVMQRIAYRRLM